MYQKYIIFLFLITILNADKLYANQLPDIIKFNGKEYNLNSNPLEPYFEENPDKKPQIILMSSNLYRGYKAYFEIIDNQLYVVDIKIQIPKDELDRKWKSVFKQIFPSSEKIKIDWYNGILVLPHGKMIHYDYMEYYTTHRKYWLLEIKNGNLKESRKYKNKGFLKFKKRQIDSFKKTMEYKKLYIELTDNEGNPSKKFINDYLSIFILDHTIKFLIN